MVPAMKPAVWTAEEVRLNLGGFFQATKQGEQIVVTRRGAPIGRWMPEDLAREADNALSIVRGLAAMGEALGSEELQQVLSTVASMATPLAGQPDGQKERSAA
jgi:antitoxin (DNA-binding transcriptional repressor) of toxin-antitoxin stability system